MSARFARTLGLAMLAARLVGAAAASAQARDTSYLAPATLISAPLVVAEPGSGEPHLLLLDGSTLLHVWRPGGTWSSEIVATGASQPDVAVSPTGVLHAAYLESGGVVAHAERIGGVWEDDTLVTLPGWTLRPTLAVDPSDGSPAIALIGVPPSGTTQTLWFARRPASSWSMVPVDSSPTELSTPSLAIGASGRPSIAWLAPAPGDGTGGLLLSEASGPSGPFTTASVDTDGVLHCALQLDPDTGSPRIGYWAFVETEKSADYFARYSSREGSWLFSTLALFLSAFPRPVSLALDSQGDPFVATTMFSPIAPHGTQGDGVLGNCGYIETGRFVAWTRSGGHNTIGFSERARLGDGTTTDAIGGRRSLASSAPGEVRGVWREPAQSQTVCAPFAALTSELAPTVGVGTGPAPLAGLALQCANPLPAGQPVRVTLSLARETEASLELHDAAGRRVSARAAERLGPGTVPIEWHPGDLRPGLYWLAARSPRALIGRRALIVVR